MDNNKYGRHLIVDLHDCNSTKLDDLKYILSVFDEVVSKSKMTVLNVSHSVFTPQGITALYLLSESHLSIHTWPEDNYTSIDLYSCGDTSYFHEIENIFVLAFESKHHTSRILERGVIECLVRT